MILKAIVLILAALIIPIGGRIARRINRQTRKDLTEGYLIGKNGEITEPPHPYIHEDDEHGIYHEKK